MMLTFPSMFVLSTRRICWKFGGTTNDIFSENRIFFRLVGRLFGRGTPRRSKLDTRWCISIIVVVFYTCSGCLLVLLIDNAGVGVGDPDGQLVSSLDQLLPEQFHNFLKGKTAEEPASQSSRELESQRPLNLKSQCKRARELETAKSRELEPGLGNL